MSFEKAHGWQRAGADERISIRGRREQSHSSSYLAINLFLAVQLFAFSSSYSAETLTGIPRVIDADTVHLAGERIRLKDIDAPETQQQCQDGNGAWFPCGVVSKRMLEVRVGSAAITCELDSKRDRYGRRLGTCYASDGENLQSWLVRNGRALAYRKYSMRYANDEAAARSAKIGMWEGRFVPPWLWRRGKRLE